MNIGEKINQFDAQLDNSVEAFNQLFVKDLTYPIGTTIQVGEMLIGGLRELLITYQDGRTEAIKSFLPQAELVWSRKLGKYVRMEGTFNKRS